MYRIKYPDIAAVFIGGCCGGAARYGIGIWLNDSKTLLGTTAVNLVGSFLLALITYGLAEYFDLPNWLILALGTGFVGAFTTFSTLVLNLVKHVGQQPVYALSIFLLNLIGGLLMALLGYLVAEWFGRRRQAW
ncbi:fluoride efflux transporter FluC [Lacticaseibacillus zhaodongensis]|uniref:fluoride efflux transporter FluC n=1 Tax=Lacticaseibacillus zhaodongensis TaxID=2668065 RepID=UPI0012D315C8|nr:CrcB family protein [Lacticaseibacillus zhaodongensis]